MGAKQCERGRLSYARGTFYWYRTICFLFDRFCWVLFSVSFLCNFSLFFKGWRVRVRPIISRPPFHAFSCRPLYSLSFNSMVILLVSLVHFLTFSVQPFIQISRFLWVLFSSSHLRLFRIGITCAALPCPVVVFVVLLRDWTLEENEEKRKKMGWYWIRFLCLSFGCFSRRILFLKERT